MWYHSPAATPNGEHETMLSVEQLSLLRSGGSGGSGLRAGRKSCPLHLVSRLIYLSQGWLYWERG
jgi:hypothetical protein